MRRCAVSTKLLMAHVEPGSFALLRGLPLSMAQPSAQEKTPREPAAEPGLTGATHRGAAARTRAPDAIPGARGARLAPRQERERAAARAGGLAGVAGVEHQGAVVADAMFGEQRVDSESAMAWVIAASPAWVTSSGRAPGPAWAWRRRDRRRSSARWAVRGPRGRSRARCSWARIPASAASPRFSATAPSSSAPGRAWVASTRMFSGGKPSRRQWWKKARASLRLPGRSLLPSGQREASNAR